MKQKISSFIIATSILTGTVVTPIAVNEVSAASIQQQKLQLKKETILVNGEQKSVTFIELDNKKLYSFREIVTLLPGKITYDNKTRTSEVTRTVDNKEIKVVYSLDSKDVVINGEKSALTATPKVVYSRLFVALEDLVPVLGGDILDNGKFIATEGLVSGDSFKPQWVNNSKLLVTNETEEDARTVVINPASKKVDFTSECNRISCFSRW